MYIMLLFTENPPYRCPMPECEEGFLKEKELSKHIRSAHPIYCDICGLRLKSEKQRESHEKTHTVPAKYRKQYPCPFSGCSRSYTKQANLNAHVRSTHECLRFCCPVVSCDRTYAHKKSLLEHIHRDHGELTLDQLEEYVAMANTNAEKNATASAVGSFAGIKTKRTASQDPPMEHVLNKRRLEVSSPETPDTSVDPGDLPLSS